MLGVSQIFGPVIQGEGSAAGRHCLFVRVFNCNLECTWCDTAYTWAVTDTKAERTQSGRKYNKYDPKYGLKEVAAEMVLSQLMMLWDIETKPTIVVISGGEPMMQQLELLPVVKQLAKWGNEVHIETAGTIAPHPALDTYVTQYNVSPKLSNSGNLLAKRYKKKALRSFVDTDKAWFKFVVTDTWWKENLEEVTDIVKDVQIPYQNVMIMPEGVTAERNITTARLIIDEVLRLGFGLTFRSHVLIWEGDLDK